MAKIYRAPFRKKQPESLTDLVTLAGMSNNAANVVMQLANPGVGHGVEESRVASGRTTDRPLKRARTTTQYLAVALYGTERDRSVYRRAIAEVHSHVHSTEESPVRYSGNARKLQLWVAACLFRYYVDQYEFVYGKLDEPTLDRLTASATTLATGVNLSAEEWPQTWSAFTEYWERGLQDVRIAGAVRDYCDDLATLRFVNEPWGPIGVVLSSILGRPFHFFTRGTIHPAFRDAMGWSWTATDQRLFEAAMRLVRVADAFFPGSLLYRGHLVDLRARVALGRNPLGPLKLDGGSRAA
ncbi:oxygenase MpaB family protein [Tsukamurella sp. 1534]|uniref:oxygenase MpaB family protein n=1 Tax=Tsukamurella sp. 1534 TaxID=1151061 RepID=UPI0002E0E9ED|nr:oxygenase MpaB family protein [Tsukamurella sp. 1534]